MAYAYLEKCKNNVVRNIDLSNDKVTWVIMAVLSVILLIVRYMGGINADVQWLILSARRLLEGQTLGHGIYELNMPYSILINIPVVILSNIFKIPDFVMVYILVMVLVWACVCMSSSILKFRGYEEFKDNVNINIFRISFLCANVLFCSLAYGQRDHLIALFMLPYSLIKLSPSGFQEHREEKKRWLNIVSLVFLSIALLLKPMYLFSVLAASVVVKKYYNRKFMEMMEVFIIGLSMSAGCAVVFVFFKDWLPVVRDTWHVYAGYEVGWMELVTSLGEGLITQYLALILLYKTHTSSLFKDKRFLYVLIFWSLANAVVFLGQRKGWYYQRIPATLYLWGCVSYDVLSFVYKKYNRHVLTFLASVMIINYIAQAIISGGVYDPKNVIFKREWTKKTKINLKENDPFECVSMSMECPFLLKVYGDYNYISRYPVMWPTLGARELYKKGKVSKEFFMSYMDRDIKNILEDINVGKPKLIIIEWPETKKGQIEGFSESAVFMNMLKSNYSLKEYVRHVPREDASTWLYVKN